MKWTALLTIALATLSLAACEATSLEQVVENTHQQRIDEANAGRPIARGARDGVGSYSADTTQKRLTLSSDDTTCP